MTTLTALLNSPIRLSERLKRHSSGQSSAVDGRPHWYFLNSWILLIPLLFFAAKGTFLHPNDPSHMGEVQSGGGGGDGAGYLLAQLSIWSLCLLFMYPVKDKIFAALAEFKLVTAIILLAIGSAAWAPEPFDTFRKGTILGLTIIFGVYLAQKFNSEEQMRLFLFLGYAAAIMSIVSVVLLPSYASGFEGEWKGVYGHKNDLGVFTIFLMTPALHIKEKEFRMKVANGFYILLCLLLIYKSESRSAWVVTALYMGYVVMARIVGRFRPLDQVVIAAAILTFLGAAGLVISQNIDSVTKAIGKNATFSGRTRIWSAVMDPIAHRPLLGYGYNGFWRGFQGESAKVTTVVGFNVPHAHNGYLNTWLQLGAVGLGLFVALLLISVYNGAISLKPNRPVWADWYLGLILLVIFTNVDESYILDINEMTTMVMIMAYIGLHRIAASTVREGMTRLPSISPVSVALSRTWSTAPRAR